MRKIKHVLLLILIVSAECAVAQTDTIDLDVANTQNMHLVGFDANAMLSQVIPFNAFQSNSAFPALVSRRLWDGKGVRVAAGLDISDDFDLNNFFVSLGYTNKKILSNRVYWVKGFDFRLYAFNDFEVGFFGIAPYRGVEFQVNPVISLSAEASLEVGIDPEWGDFVLQLRPPVHIQCHFYINRGK